MNIGPQPDQLFTLTFEQPDVNSRSEPECKVIAALQNSDWREIARRRRARAKMYIPPGGHTGAGASGSGVGPGDTLNSEPAPVGLHKRKRARVDVDVDVNVDTKQDAPIEPDPSLITEDERAIRALIADAEGGDGSEDHLVDIIPMGNRSSTRRAPTEDDAYKEDVEQLPSEATQEDYERMPVSQFGAALLRGMGWKPGEPASRNKKRGIVEPWLPLPRPAMLGLGAKEREVFDDGSGGKRGTPSRPDKKYTPLLRLESGRSSPRSQTASRSESRRASRSPPRKERKEDDRDRRRDVDRQRERDGRKDRNRESERDRDWDRRRDRERSPGSTRRDRDRRDR